MPPNHTEHSAFHERQMSNTEMGGERPSSKEYEKYEKLCSGMDFVDNLSRSTLVNNEVILQCKQLFGTHSGFHIARNLIDNGILTVWQATCLVQGKWQNLRIAQNVVILEPIGKGAMGKVYRGRDCVTETDVAVKVLDPEQYTESAADRFRREAAIGASVARIPQFPFVRGHYKAPDGKTECIIMEFIDGKSIAKILHQEGCYGLQESLSIIHEIAVGLKALHKENIIHRDIKPGNILIGRDGRVYIIDLGLARKINYQDPNWLTRTLTKQQTSLGTPDYMSPEQVYDPHKAMGASDMYSLGIVWYAMIHGAAPRYGKTIQEVTIRRTQSPCPPLFSSPKNQIEQKAQAIYEEMVKIDPTARIDWDNERHGFFVRFNELLALSAEGADDPKSVRIRMHTKFINLLKQYIG